MSNNRFFDWIKEYSNLKVMFDIYGNKDNDSLKKMSLNRFLNDFDNVQSAIDSLSNVNVVVHESQFSLFDIASQKVQTHTPHIDEIRIKSNNLFEKFIEEKIFVIPYYAFKDFSFLNNIEIRNQKFFFIKGSKWIEILMKNQNDVVSVVGSRETPEQYGKWFSDLISQTNVVVVSGMANGADSIGHREAMKQNKLIAIFPGYPLDSKVPTNRQDIWDYALSNGVIISSEYPFEKNNKPAAAMLLDRNEQMARVSHESYVLWFKNKSGTHYHIASMIRDGKKVFVPNDVFIDNKQYLHTEFIELVKPKVKVSIDMLKNIEVR